MARKTNKSIDDLKRKSHLVVTLSFYSDFGKPSEEKISDLTFIELCGSEQAAINQGKMSSKVMNDKDFASKSFNSLSQSLVNNTVNKNKKKKSRKDDNSTILSMLVSSGLRDPATNVILVCTIPPDVNRFKHSLSALKF